MEVRRVVSCIEGISHKDISSWTITPWKLLFAIIIQESKTFCEFGKYCSCSTIYSLVNLFAYYSNSSSLSAGPINLTHLKHSLRLAWFSKSISISYAPIDNIICNKNDMLRKNSTFPFLYFRYTECLQIQSCQICINSDAECHNRWWKFFPVKFGSIWSHVAKTASSFLWWQRSRRNRGTIQCNGGGKSGRGQTTPALSEYIRQP